MFDVLSLPRALQNRGALANTSFSDRLVYAFLPDGNVMRDQVSGIALTPENSNITSQQASIGYVRRYTGNGLDRSFSLNIPTATSKSTGKLSFATWLKPKSLLPNKHYWAEANTGASYTGLISTATENQLVWAMGGGNNVTITTPTDFYGDQFHFIVCVYNGSNHRSVYFNGDLIYSSTSGLAVPSNYQHIGLGGLNRNSSEYDSVCEIGFHAGWSRALSVAEILELSMDTRAIFTAIPARFYLIPSSGGGTYAVYQDGLIRWSLLQTISQDAFLQWDVKISLENDLLTRWNILTGVLADTTIRWDALAAIQADIPLRWDVASVLSAVQQDASIRWNLLSAIQQDVMARWNSLASVEQDVALRWNLLTAIDQDTILRWHTLTRVEQDHLLRWNALQSLSNDQAIRWDVLYTIFSAQNDVALRWNSLSAVQQDALLRWNLATQIEQSLSTRWNLLNAVEISQAVRWEIAVAVANDIALRWDSTESLTASDLLLTWNLLAVSENQIELRWNIGDNSLTPGTRIFLVRGDDRIFHVVSEDRTFGVI